MTEPIEWFDEPEPTTPPALNPLSNTGPIPSCQATTTPARDAIYDQLRWNAAYWGDDELGAPAEIAHRLIDAFVRELAETIRSQHSAVYNDAGQKTAEGLLRAADLIDSQVTPVTSTAPDPRRTIDPSGPMIPGKESPHCLNCGKYARADSTIPGGVRHLFGTVECDPQVTP